MTSATGRLPPGRPPRASRRGEAATAAANSDHEAAEDRAAMNKVARPALRRERWREPIQRNHERAVWHGREFYPEIEPYADRLSAGGRAASDLLRAVRQPEGRAGRVPAWRAGRGRQPDAPPLLRSRALPHRRPRPARRRPLEAAGRDHRQHDAAPDRRPRDAARRISASTAGWFSAAPGARPWPSPMPRPMPTAAWRWCCAASSSAARARSTGSSTACAPSLRRSGATSPATCRRRSAATS